MEAQATQKRHSALRILDGGAHVKVGKVMTTQAETLYVLQYIKLSI